jgi:hypothetical protein
MLTDSSNDLHLLPILILEPGSDPASIMSPLRRAPDLHEHEATRHHQAGRDRDQGPEPTGSEERPSVTGGDGEREKGGKGRPPLCPVDGVLVGDGDDGVLGEGFGKGEGLEAAMGVRVWLESCREDVGRCQETCHVSRSRERV